MRLFAYVSHRIPEISDEIYRVDDAMRAGFGWEIGAFETWDLFGVEETIKKMKAAGYQVADWVKEMLAEGITSFYKIEKGEKFVVLTREKEICFCRHRRFTRFYCNAEFRKPDHLEKFRGTLVSSG